MAEQKGSLKNRLLTNRIIKVKLKKKKLDEEELEKEKREEELKKIKDAIFIKPALKELVVDPDNLININDNPYLKLEETLIALENSVLIDEGTVVIEKKEPMTVENTKNKSPKKTTYITKEQLIDLEEKVDKQIDQNEREEVITDKVDKIILEAKKDIAELRDDLERLVSPVEEEYDGAKLKQKQAKFDELKEKISKIKAKYEVLKNNIDFTEFEDINDEILVDEIENYKFVIDDNVSITNLARECRMEIKQMELITEVAHEKEQLSKKLAHKKKEIEERDEDFKKHKKDIENIEDSNAKITKIMNDLEYDLKAIDERITNIGDPKLKKEIKKAHFFTNNILQLAFLMSGIKKKNRGLVFASYLMMNFSKKTKVEIDKTDFNRKYQAHILIDKELDNANGYLDSAANSLKYSLNDINDLKKYFSEHFSKYVDLIPEYREISNKIDMVIEMLKKKQKDLEASYDEISKEKEKNKIKIHKLEGII